MSQKLKLVLLSLLFSVSTAVNAMSVTGIWLTNDDKTGKPRSTIQITESNGTYVGQIMNVIKMPGDTGFCHHCPGQFKDQKVQGLQILWGLHKTGEFDYTGGKILDPKSGSVYHCNIKLSPDGKTLHVRGYIGVPMFGRSQVWQRVEKAELPSETADV